ncbi:MFS general substrate transporter [Microthyrium microscopicum]|uniref:MFS general substrate transporter n=1 Tax=Microthyrium microscopicum TaxID=703497 RepID=A0A6A6UUL6_9PEZI|nr:MFS general substrate transporter [Microthyrium microscopicum]
MAFGTSIFRRASPATNKSSKSFPTRQLFILALCRLCEPIAFMSIFPYIYYMVKSFDITDDERQIAFYAGIVTSAFAMAEFMASLFWGRLSDSIGRKPVLLTGIFGTGISMLMFGFAPNLPMALLARALGGILNGNIGVLSTVVAEVVTNKEHQPRAFSIMPFVWSVGSMIGAAIGGSLAEPVKNYPNTFHKGSIFDKFPYLLPNLVCTACVAVSFIFGILFLEETHEEKKDRKDVGLTLGNWFLGLFSSKAQITQDQEEGKLMLPFEDEKKSFDSVESSPSLLQGDALSPALPVSRKRYAIREMLTPQIRLIIMSYGVLAFHTISFEQLLPILFSMPKSDIPAHLPFKFLGGLELTTKTIGMILAVQGGLQVIAQLVVFPLIVARLGPLRTFRLVIFSYPVLYCLVPYLTLAPGFIQHIGIGIILVWKVTGQALSYPSSNIMLVNHTPSKNVLGTLNGFVASAASLARTLGPVFAGMVQAAGLKAGISGLSWWTCAVVAVIGAVISLGQESEPVQQESIIDDDESERLLGDGLYRESSDIAPLPSSHTNQQSIEDVPGTKQPLLADI